MKIVAIGGGENGRPGTEYEIKEFDEEIVRMTGKSQPNFLFIGFAQSDSERQQKYFNVMNNNFSALSCECVKLEESDLKDRNILESKILNADIIYVGGGNTLRLMTLLRKYGAVELIKQAGENGAVLCGVSAGAICWCTYGNSDSRKFTSGSNQLIKVSGMGFVDALYCPHYDEEGHRQKDLIRMMKSTKGVALAFESCAALKIVDDEFFVLKTRERAKAYKCYYLKGEYIKTELPESGKVKDLISKV